MGFFPGRDTTDSVDITWKLTTNFRGRKQKRSHDPSYTDNALGVLKL